MSFQAYIDNIRIKTGKTPTDFKKIAEERGMLAPGIKAGQIVVWLKEDFGLGHGHAMAIYATLKPENISGAETKAAAMKAAAGTAKKPK